MSVRFLHTADWQLGKPFAGIADPSKRARVQQERLEVIARLGAVAREQGAAFVVVAGDLFDSDRVSRATVAAACHAIGRLEIPVLAIPGNHDFAGPGSFWDQEMFESERARLAPNFQLLREAAPVTVAGAVLLPCPLRRRTEAADPTAWLRDDSVASALDPALPRIVVAHGSVQGFGGASDDDDGSAGASNRLDLERLPAGLFDYVALGDWHGTVSVTPGAWYSGTPEPDRFPKGADYVSGQVLQVTAARGAAPQVAPVRTGRLDWRVLSADLPDAGALERLESAAASLTPESLLKLELRGTLGLESMTRLERWLESLEALVLRLKLDNGVVLAPTPEECAALATRPEDPLISRVAAQLLTRAAAGGEHGLLARLALRELHAACRNP